MFKLTRESIYTVLHSFELSGGAYPWAGLAAYAAGDLYGTTANDGVDASGVHNAAGVVFKVVGAGFVSAALSQAFPEK